MKLIVHMYSNESDWEVNGNINPGQEVGTIGNGRESGRKTFALISMLLAYKTHQPTTGLQ